MMKRFLILSLTVLTLAACTAAPSVSASNPGAAQQPPSLATAAPDGGQEPAVSAPAGALAAEDTLSTDYEDATNLRNQLAYGTLLLEGTDQAVSAEQARSLLPLWQAVLALSGDSTSVSEEISAVQVQIIETMTADQLQAIADLQITNAELDAFYAERGIVLPTPQPGVTRVPGAMKDLPPEARQATQAARQASGEAGAGAGKVSRTLLNEEVIQLLAGRAAQ